MSYVTGITIKKLREKRKMTQRELAERISVSDKTISKWETEKGLPDIAVIEDLAKALGVSIQELLTGDYRENENPSANMKKLHVYVCPVCGNVIMSVGKGSFTCCGITLPEQEADIDREGVYGAEHHLELETVDNEYLLTMNHPMTKKHYISFAAYVTSEAVSMVKLYPEQEVCVRFRKQGHGFFYVFCNQHGLYRMSV